MAYKLGKDSLRIWHELRRVFDRKTPVKWTVRTRKKSAWRLCLDQFQWMDCVRHIGRLSDWLLCVGVYKPRVIKHWKNSSAALDHPWILFFKKRKSVYTSLSSFLLFKICQPITFITISIHCCFRTQGWFIWSAKVSMLTLAIHFLLKQHLL